MRGVPYRTMHERLRDEFLTKWARLVTSRPRVTLLVVAAVAVASLAFASFRLDFLPDRSDLVSREREWNRRYLAYKSDFPRWGDVIVCLEGEPEDRSVDQLARVLADHLRSLDGVRAADAGFDPRSSPRLFHGAAWSEFEQAVRGVAAVRRIARAANVNAAIATMLDARAQAGVIDDAAVRHISDVVAPAVAILNGDESAFCVPGLGDDAWQPFVTSSGRIRTISIDLGSADGSLSGLGARLDLLRDAVSRTLAVENRPELVWGVTGIPAIEADETAQSIADSSRASIVSFVLIVGLMLVAFRGMRVPLMAACALLLGLAWSVGWAAAAVGHLQVLSVIFGSILMGLGIDYALHLVSRLELIAHEGDEITPLMERVFRSVGPGILTGAVTTAVAFFVIALTDFRGAAELGVISGGGVLLCFVAVVSAFPALLAVSRRWKSIVRHHQTGENAPFLVHLLHWVYEHPKTTVGMAAALAVALGWNAREVRYDPNILNLQPPGVESVVWERRLADEDARSAWAGLVAVRQENAAAVAASLREAEQVSSVGGAAILVPDRLEERRSLLETAAAANEPPISLGDGPQPLVFLIAQVERALAEAVVAPERLAGACLDELVQRLGAARERSQSVEPAALAAEWESLNLSFLAQREALAAFANRALDPSPLSASDLPEALRSRWVGADGSWLLLAYPWTTDRNILEPDRLEAFVASARAAAPTLMGPPVQIYESSRLIQSAYVRAAWYSLPVIIIMLLMDFRSLADAICAIVPVALAFLAVFGLLAALGFTLNFANMMVLPVILGICVDAGVHVVHRWRDDPAGKPPGLSGGTGRGITLMMLTTIFGFATLMLAEHRGIRSLGFVMTVGLATTMIASFTVLPAILALRRLPLRRPQTADD
jgi:hopanoid biosynthesis associated RND transporter like protein HpnN